MEVWYMRKLRDLKQKWKFQGQSRNIGMNGSYPYILPKSIGIPTSKYATYVVPTNIRVFIHYLVANMFDKSRFQIS